VFQAQVKTNLDKKSTKNLNSAHLDNVTTMKMIKKVCVLLW